MAFGAGAGAGGVWWVEGIEGLCEAELQDEAGVRGQAGSEGLGFGGARGKGVRDVEERTAGALSGVRVDRRGRAGSGDGREREG